MTEAMLLSPRFTTAIILLTLWTLPWKGVALWRAARRGEMKWFIVLLVVNSVAILEIIYIFGFSERPQTKKLAE